MTTPYVQGCCMIDYTPDSAVAAGDVIVQAQLVGIALSPIAAGAKGALCVDGIFEMPKVADTAIDAGKTVYWNDVDEEVTEDVNDGGDPAHAYIPLGKTVEDAAAEDETVKVRLRQ